MRGARLGGRGAGGDIIDLGEAEDAGSEDLTRDREIWAGRQGPSFYISVKIGLVVVLIERTRALLYLDSK